MAEKEIRPKISTKKQRERTKKLAAREELNTPTLSRCVQRKVRPQRKRRKNQKNEGRRKIGARKKKVRVGEKGNCVPWHRKKSKTG